MHCTLKQFLNILKSCVGWLFHSKCKHHNMQVQMNVSSHTSITCNNLTSWKWSSEQQRAPIWDEDIRSWGEYDHLLVIGSFNHVNYGEEVPCELEPVAEYSSFGTMKLLDSATEDTWHALGKQWSLSLPYHESDLVHLSHLHFSSYIILLHQQLRFWQCRTTRAPCALQPRIPRRPRVR